MTIIGDPDSTGKWDGVWGNAGFGAICATGMKDDTWARAVVLESGDATVAMVSLDVVGLFNVEVQRMREELQARYPDMQIDEEFYLESDNNVLRALVVRGVFDVPTFVGGDSWGSDPDAHTEGTMVPKVGSQVRTEMVQVDFGRPFEPVIAHHDQHQFQFVLGLGQDELGYIIPGYDFHLLEAPADVAGGPAVLPLGGLEDGFCGEGHYEETVSISSAFAPWVACAAVELAGGDPWETEAACTRENTSTNPYGLGGSDGRQSGEGGELNYQEARRIMIEAMEHSHGHSHLATEQQADASIDWGTEDTGATHTHEDGTHHPDH